MTAPLQSTAFYADAGAVISQAVRLVISLCAAMNAGELAAQTRALNHARSQALDLDSMVEALVAAAEEAEHRSALADSTEDVCRPPKS